MRPLDQSGGRGSRTVQRECPFCPGNEDLLAGIVREWPCVAAPGWSQRALYNKFPALSSDAAPRDRDGVKPGRGWHWVLVDTPRHDRGLIAMSPDEATQLMIAYRDSYRQLAATAGVRFVSLFHNHGSGAGASLRHPHSQLVAMEMWPPAVVRSCEWLGGQARKMTGCPLCHHLAVTIAEASRLIEDEDGFVTMIPFAPVQPFEQLIVPRRHAGSFETTTDEELRNLAGSLQRALRRLDLLLGSPPFNLSVESMPSSGADPAISHWHVRVVPRLTTGGGFEQSTRMPIVPGDPESNAAQFRQLQVDRAGKREHEGPSGFDTQGRP